jgi:hypothetical protein
MGAAVYGTVIAAEESSALRCSGQVGAHAMCLATGRCSEGACRLVEIAGRWNPRLPCWVELKTRLRATHARTCEAREIVYAMDARPLSK